MHTEYPLDVQEDWQRGFQNQVDNFDEELVNDRLNFKIAPPQNIGNMKI